MALPTSFDPNQPIPNNPFYSPETYIIRGAYNPFIVGSGITVDQDGVISATGGGGGGVLSVIAGAGISLSASTGNVTISNAGVTSLVAGVGVTLSAATGAIIVSATNTGTVTSISTGTGLTGGPITSSGTIALTNTGVTASTYTNPSITVDAQGRITAASSGTAIGAVVGTSPINVSTVAGTSTVSVDAASLTQAGVVQLSDSVTDTSIAYAATANAVKTAFDAAVAAIPKACLTGKGALVSATGASIPAPLAVGNDGEVLTADSTAATGLKWVPVTPGVASVSGTAPITVDNTDPLNPIIGVSDATQTTTGVVLGLTNAYNTALGSVALPSVTTGSGNTAIGLGSLYYNTAGGNNVAIGQGSLQYNTGSSNTAIGTAAGSSYTGNCSVLIGNNIQTVTNDDCQLAIGYDFNQKWLTGDSTLAITPGAGIVDCTASVGTSNLVLTSQGNAIEWKSVNSSIAAPNYGSFYSTTTQTPNVLSVGQALTLDSTAYSNNFSIVGGSQITAAASGVYNLQLSLQLIVTTGGGGNFEVWFVKNGTPVANSNSQYAVKNTNEAEIAALNFIETLNAGDYLEVYWAADDTHLNVVTLASAMGGPAIPSAIVTIVPVGA